jgi:hypothetical protein
MCLDVCIVDMSKDEKNKLFWKMYDDLPYETLRKAVKIDTLWHRILRLFQRHLSISHPNFDNSVMCDLFQTNHLLCIYVDHPKYNGPLYLQKRGFDYFRINEDLSSLFYPIEQERKYLYALLAEHQLC